MNMSHPALSADTEVVLLLCGQFGGERQEPYPPLSAREYGDLAQWLNLRSLRPADLLTEDGKAQLPALHEARLEQKRVDFLLGRGTALALALERWSRSGLWVISRGDAAFPKRLKRHFRHAAPPLLYGAGRKELLDMGGLAIIGSRDATEAALSCTREVAAQCAREGMGVVSGGARGVDAAAMQGAIDAGGCAMGVLTNDLLKASVNRQNRLGLQEGRLVLVSPFYPEAGFSAGHAMERNKYIYALSDRALVVDSALGSGGTWTGALEALGQQWVPLYVRTPGNGPGNAELVRKGGIAFAVVPGQGASLLDCLVRAAPEVHPLSEPVPAQQSLLTTGQSASDVGTAVAMGAGKEEPSEAPREAPAPAGMVTVLPGAGPAPVSLDMYADFLAKLDLALVAGPLLEAEVSERLGLEQGQAKAWLKKAVVSGRVEKLKNPVRYAPGAQASLLG